MNDCATEGNGIDINENNNRDASETEECRDETISASDTGSDKESEETEAVYPEFRCIEKCGYFLSQLHEKFDEHSFIACSLKDLKLIRTRRKALKVEYTIKCDKCGYIDSFWSDPVDDDAFDINTAAVIGTMSSGIGYNTMQEFLAALNVECMCPETYRKYREIVLDIFLETAEESMKQAAEEERQAAIDRGHVINGIPWIQVIADGQWTRRSYGHSFNALSGVGVIIGEFTKKVLYVGIKNKYCSYCAFYEREGKPCPQHRCYKNFDRDLPSSQMESEAIAEGFKYSVQMHGLIYKTLIADNDSNVYKAIRDCRPYDAYKVVVDKIQCVNHLYRRMCKNLTTLAEKTQPPGQRQRGFVSTRAILQKKIVSIRDEIVAASAERRNSELSKEEQAAELQKDILIIPRHIFGDHSLCQERGLQCPSERCCKENVWPKIIEHGFDKRITEIIENLSAQAPSLITNKTNNAAELFNSVLCKLIAGKRIFFSARCSNDIRVLGSVVQYNSHQLLTKVHQKKGKKVPTVIENFDRRRQEGLLRTNNYRAEHGRSKSRRSARGSRYYGDNPEDTDMNFTEYEIIKAQRLDEVYKVNAANWKDIEENTRDQNASGYWGSARQQMLTASNFGVVCRRRATTSCASLVADLLYPSYKDTKAMDYGKKNEPLALKKLSGEIRKPIDKCGLFIDQTNHFLGASPDGLIGSDGLVEVKCPITAQGKTFAQAYASVPTVRRMFAKNDPTQLNPNHHYYYQVQGQLNITGRRYCKFAVWTDKDIHVVDVKKDETFWRTKMVPSLTKFFMDCMLPEMIDSRRARGLPLRDPDYIIEAQKIRENQKQQQQQQKASRKEGKRKEKGDETQRKKQRTACERIESHVADDPAVSESVDVPTQSFRIPRISEEAALAYEDELLELPGTVEEQRIYVMNQIMNLDAIKRITLPVDSRLGDGVVNSFLRIVRETTFYDNEDCRFLSYIELSVPCVYESIQILGGGNGEHWRCLHFDGENLHVYDSIPTEVGYDRLTVLEKRYIQLRFDVSKENIFFPAVTAKQPDLVSCGVYAAAFATSIALNRNPVTERYSRSVKLLRQHLVTIIAEGRLIPFPCEVS